MTAEAILLLLSLLMIKHMFADYFLQTRAMLLNRAVYLHLGRTQHCLIHIAGSALSFLLMGMHWSIWLWVVLAEFVAHFHIDFAKGWWSKRVDDGPGDASFWRVFGLDQTLHGLTYIVMVWAVL